MKEFISIKGLNDYVMSTSSTDGVIFETSSENMMKDYNQLEMIIQNIQNEKERYYTINVIVIVSSKIKIETLELNYMDGMSAGAYYTLNDGRLAIVKGYSHGSYGFNCNWCRVLEACYISDIDKVSGKNLIPLNYIVNSYRSSKAAMKHITHNYDVINLIVR